MTEKKTKIEEPLEKISKNLEDINNTIKEVCSKSKEIERNPFDKEIEFQESAGSRKRISSGRLA